MRHNPTDEELIFYKLRGLLLEDVLDKVEVGDRVLWLPEVDVFPIVFYGRVRNVWEERVTIYWADEPDEVTYRLSNPNLLYCDREAS